MLASEAKIANCVLDLVQSLSEDFVRRFIDVLHEHQDLKEVNALRIMRAVNNDAARDLLSSFVRDVRGIDPNLSASALGLGIECGLAAVKYDTQKQSIDVVWTGPGTESAIRRTAPVLLELIRSAEEEIVVISFAAFRITDALDIFEEKARRGVRMHFILESREDSDGRLYTDAAAAFDTLAAYPNVKFYAWPIERRPWGALLHAKAIIVDGRTALTTSANLTENAISANIELGLLIRGGDAPARIHEHIIALIHQHTLSESKQ